MKRQYKALMLDLDGTTIPNDPQGMPSQKVIQAIAAANKKLSVGVITGRPHYFAKKVLTQLNLSGPSIFSGGAKIIDDDKIIWESPLLAADVTFIHNFLKELGVSFWTEGEQREWTEMQLDILPPQKIYGIAAKDLTNQQAENILDTIKSSTTINGHKIVGWQEGTYWVQITHAGASKHHGILKVAELLKIEPHEIIGVGDGYNDFPLLMACGLKVAMGNAVPELKAIADYVAPTVDDDGVADIIEKFVL